MKFITLAAAAAMALGVVACSSPEDQQAEAQADALESQAADTSNEQLESQLNAQADQIEQEAGSADDGATEENTPDTSPSQ